MIFDNNQYKVLEDRDFVFHVEKYVHNHSILMVRLVKNDQVRYAGFEGVFYFEGLLHQKVEYCEVDNPAHRKTLFTKLNKQEEISIFVNHLYSFKIQEGWIHIIARMVTELDHIPEFLLNN